MRMSKVHRAIFRLMAVLFICFSPSVYAGTMGGYWTYTTQYVPNTVFPYPNFDGKIQVALPDKYMKFCRIYNKCTTNYPSERSYTINFYDGKYSISNMGVGEVGPWNENDNWWDPASNWPRVRRTFADLPQGTPEAYKAVCCQYNGGKDQSNRIITTKPYGPGMDMSTNAAAWLGWKSLENRWVYIYYFNWDY